jgi:DNA-directed RNA polymerase subunit M/transcription elongation factor TFIIS
MSEVYTHDTFKCKKCGEADVYYTSEETYDGSQDRYYYHCHSCEFRWRVVTDYD